MMQHQIEIYTSPDGSTQIEVQFEGDTFWLNLNQISSLFEKDKSLISMHLKNVFTIGELIRDSVVAKNATTAQDGKPMLQNTIIQMQFCLSATALTQNEAHNSANGQRKD